MGISALLTKEKIVEMHQTKTFLIAVNRLCQDYKNSLVEVTALGDYIIIARVLNCDGTDMGPGVFFVKRHWRINPSFLKESEPVRYALQHCAGGIGYLYSDEIEVTNLAAAEAFVRRNMESRGGLELRDAPVAITA